MKILYFAWLKAKTGVGEEDVTPPEAVTTVGQLIDWLAARGGGFAEAFATRELVRAAVNQDYARPETPVKAGDEVAFFPPVTGG
jgi:molybdopterin synthase sulfur carrier subunit